MRPLPRQPRAARLPALLLLLSLALLLLARCGAAAAAGADAQLEALIKIREGFNNSATALPSWDATTSPCDWGASSGVVCDSTGAVTKILLLESGLAGTLSAEGWDALTDLRQLVIVGNPQLTGPLPANWSLPDGLQYLHLYGNALTGTLPADLRLPSGLVELDLSDNRLVGTIPTSWDFQSATQLQLLSLSINNLTGALPNALPSGLITLQLAENALSGTLPPGAWLPPALVNCSLQDNALRGSIPADFRLPASLEKLDLCDNRLEGSIPAGWQLNDGLAILTACGNRLTGSIPADWALPATLRSLYLFNNSLQGPLPANWTLPASLLELALSSNQLTGTIPEDWLPDGLQALYLFNNSLSGPLPATLPTALSDFRASNNRLSGSISSTWPEGLEWLLLDGNELTGAIPTGLPDSLTVVDFSSNRLSTTLPPGWVLPAQLAQLYLQNSSLAGPIPSNWTLNSALKVLQLQENDLSGSIPPDWQLPPALQVLQLHNNSLSGTLAPEWGLPQSLVEFTLADNPVLGGPLPNATWSLPNLRLAALWGCNFTGSLPSSWEVNPAAVVAVLPQEGEGFCGELPSSPPYYERDLSSNRDIRLQQTDLSNCLVPGESPSPPPSPSPPEQPGGGGSSSTGIIIGVVVGCVVVAVLIIGLWWWKCCRKAPPPAEDEKFPASKTVTGEEEAMPSAFEGAGGDKPWELLKKVVIDSAALSSLAGRTPPLPPGSRKSSMGNTSQTLSIADDKVLQLAIRAARSGSSLKVTSPKISTSSTGTGRASSMGLDLKVWEIPYESLELVKQIGEGSFGRVYMAKWHELLVAVKILLNTGWDNTEEGAAAAISLSNPVLENLHKEAGLMAALRHPNVVGFLGVCPAPPCVVTEYCSRGSLNDVLRAAKNSSAKAAQLDWPRRLNMMLDAAKGMLYLHEHNPAIIHRDLKSPNLLVDVHWRVKVSDFNLSKILGDTLLLSSAQATNPRWLAPEVLAGASASLQSDVYSFGVVLWEMLTWEIPFAADNHWQLVRFVPDGGRLEIPDRMALPGPDTATFGGLDDYTGLIRRCWAQEPADRPGFQHIIDSLREMLARATRQKAARAASAGSGTLPSSPTKMLRDSAAGSEASTARAAGMGSASSVNSPRAVSVSGGPPASSAGSASNSAATAPIASQGPPTAPATPCGPPRPADISLPSIASADQAEAVAGSAGTPVLPGPSGQGSGSA